MRFGIVLIAGLCFSLSFAADVEEDDAAVSSLEEHGIEAWENQDQDGARTFSVAVARLNANGRDAGLALRNFAKVHKVTRFFGSPDSVLTADFFKASGALPDVRRLDLYPLSKQKDYSAVEDAFPNVEKVNMIELGVLGSNAPIFSKAKTLRAASTSFDDEGLLKLAKMPDAEGCINAAATVTEKGLERYAAALTPESKAIKPLDFSFIRDPAPRRTLEKKARSLGLLVSNPLEEKEN